MPARSSKQPSTRRPLRETAGVRRGGRAPTLRSSREERRALGRGADSRRLWGLLRRRGRGVPARRAQLETDAARPLYVRRLAAGDGFRDRGGRSADVPRLRHPSAVAAAPKASRRRLDRKSTRLNSSHMSISYAVFCLKKKKKTKSRLSHLNKKIKKKKIP